MRGWPQAKRAVKRPRRHDKNTLLGLQKRQRRTAVAAKALYMPRSGKAEGRDLVLARKPGDPCPGGEQVCRMGRTAVLAAARAMTQEKAVELSRYVKAHSAAKAFSMRQVVHSKAFRFVTGNALRAVEIRMVWLGRKAGETLATKRRKNPRSKGLHPPTVNKPLPQSCKPLKSLMPENVPSWDTPMALAGQACQRPSKPSGISSTSRFSSSIRRRPHSAIEMSSSLWITSSAFFTPSCPIAPRP